MSTEKGIKKQIASSLVIVLLVSLMLAAISFFVFRELSKAQVDEAESYTSEVTLQYKNTITKLINGDMQTLHALAGFIGEQPDYSLTQIIDNLRTVNDLNKFYRMGFVNTEGMRYLVGMNGVAINDVYLGDEQFVKEALSGVPSISDTKKDEYSENYIVCYAVPMYRGDELIGVLTAVNKSTEFGSPLDQSLFNGEGYIHIVNSKGEFIIRSEHSGIELDIRNIFEDNYLADVNKKDILSRLKDGGDEFMKIKFLGKDSWLCFKELEVNDWYLLCIVPESTLNSNFLRLGRNFGIVFLCIIVMFILLFTYIYRISKRSRKSIEHLAYFDALTGIYNRNKFWEEGSRLLQNRKTYGLIIFDVVNFKFINELFGYDKGDMLLLHIAQICSQNAGPDELYYREGGDHFGMLLKYDSEQSFTERVRQILTNVSTCPICDSQNYKIVCSCGIKVIDSYTSGTDLDLSCDRATLALKEAKTVHENTIVYYDSQLHEKIRLRNEIESTMQEALDKDEFVMKLQPKIDLDTGEIVGAEALVRWEGRDGRTRYPDQFIPLFEKNGFVANVDMYMMETACRYLREWADLGYPVVPISVNQSRLIFYKDDYMMKLNGLIEKYRIDSSLIILEVTEGITIGNLDEMKQVIRQIHQMGFSVSMDDFGSGYSSLNILKDLEIDELKLDKVFLDDAEDNEKRNQIMKNVIRLAKDLSISTVVEGIEDADQAEFVKSIGCDIGQGYYYSRPIAVEKFVDTAFKKC